MRFRKSFITDVILHVPIVSKQERYFFHCFYPQVVVVVNFISTRIEE